MAYRQEVLSGLRSILSEDLNDHSLNITSQDLDVEICVVAAGFVVNQLSHSIFGTFLVYHILGGVKVSELAQGSIEEGLSVSNVHDVVIEK